MGAVMSRERDARVTSRMSPEDRLVHQRLEAWSRWSAEARHSTGLSPIARMMELGLVAAGADSAPVSMPEAIMEVETAVGTLPKVEERVIRRYYLHWEPTEITAKMLRMSIRDLQRLLKQARFRIGITLDLNARRSGGISTNVE
jgi:DNA-directed RNA polymerase specialized sigma24 family protein